MIIKSIKPLTFKGSVQVSPSEYQDEPLVKKLSDYLKLNTDANIKNKISIASDSIEVTSGVLGEKGIVRSFEIAGANPISSNNIEALIKWAEKTKPLLAGSVKNLITIKPF